MNLHARIAKALGWTERDVRSFSLQSVRELVRPVDPKLAREIDLVVREGNHLAGKP